MDMQAIAEAIRKENYIQEIYEAFKGTKKTSVLTKQLISFVQNIYRSLEPSHFGGQLIVYTTFDDSILFEEKTAIKLIDRNLLFNNTSNNIIFQYFQGNALPLMWQNISLDQLLNNSNAIIYGYQNGKEYFYANQKKINITNHFGCASIFALYYHELNIALQNYKNEKIINSSCTIFNECWFDPDSRIYFKHQPEEKMQLSLEQFLKSALRGVDVEREHNCGASKPVDVHVYWKVANRAALIELKWLGQSKNNDGTLATSYSQGRGNDGLRQLKEYIDLTNRDTPTRINRGYLVIIDARRRSLSKNPNTVNQANGIFYASQEIEFDNALKYFETFPEYERPIRMFATPICS